MAQPGGSLTQAIGRVPEKPLEGVEELSVRNEPLKKTKRTCITSNT